MLTNCVVSVLSGIAAALKEVFSDNEHRTPHWVQLISIANSSGASDATVASLEKEVEALQSAMQRSRSPRMRPRQGALPPSQGMLALLAAASSQSKGVRAWKSEQQQAESWSWQEWRRQERWRQRWPWSHAFRADHGFGPTGIVPAVPRVVQGDVLEVPEGAVQRRRIRAPTQAQLHWLRQGREALQILPLPAIEAQLIIPLQTF